LKGEEYEEAIPGQSKPKKSSGRDRKFFGNASIVQPSGNPLKYSIHPKGELGSG